MQDKVNNSKITEIRKERNANSVLYWFGHALCLCPVLSNPLDIFTNFVNPFTTSEPPRDTLPLCSGNFTNQETHCLLINNSLL
ncbi:hypothetical protein GmHk_09G024976 [Glycine max]|nr:hypothetical protein GmHk_09G024976 [Glycine max]